VSIRRRYAPRVEDTLAAAIANNVAWCALVCRMHGLIGRERSGVWAVDRRPPSYYPDAITLSPSATADDVLALVDRTPGCAVKDSFARLDLAPHGFRVLFDASWFAADAAPTGDLGDLAWEAVADGEGLSAWVRAWSEDGDPEPPFDVALLAERDVVILAARREGVVAGAIANAGPGDVVGISNVFAAEAELDATWSGVRRELERRWPGRLVVGYEHGPGLDAARRHGAMTTGPLRIWTNG
jgi:hypothetical protein